MLRNCSICNKPYQIKSLGLGKFKTTLEIPVCDCESKKQEENQKKEKYNERQELIRKLFKEALIPNEFKDATFENFKKRDETEMAFKRCIEYANNFEKYKKSGQGLYLSGDIRMNKTYLSIAIIQYLIKKYVSCIFITTADLLDLLRDSYKKDNYYEIMCSVKSCELLVLDDFGVENINNSDWVKEKLYQIINYRYNYHLPIIITSQYQMPNMEIRIGKRINRRIQDKTLGLHIGLKDYPVS